MRGAAEFLLVGGLTPLALALSWVIRRKLPLSDAEYAAGFFTFCAAFVVNDPHFTVSYLLFYRGFRARALGPAFTGAQRVRYWFAGVVAPIALAAWAVAALASRSPLALGLMIQLMFFWVGFHYVKQGSGVMLALSARRGVTYAPAERTAIVAHALAGWAYAWATPYDPGREVIEKGVIYTTIAHPRWLEPLTLACLIITAIALSVALLAKWRRDRRLPIGTPLTALLCSIWAWSIFSGRDPLVRYLVPALHSVQYLYFVYLMRGNEAAERERPPWFEATRAQKLAVLFGTSVALGALVFHAAPSAIDAAVVPRAWRFTDLGATPCFAALYAFINLHHYLIDWVIWRRDNAETRYLRVS